MDPTITKLNFRMPPRLGKAIRLHAEFHEESSISSVIRTACRTYLLDEASALMQAIERDELKPPGSELERQLRERRRAYAEALWQVMAASEDPVED